MPAVAFALRHTILEKAKFESLTLEGLLPLAASFYAAW